MLLQELRYPRKVLKCTAERHVNMPEYILCVSYSRKFTVELVSNSAVWIVIGPNTNILFIDENRFCLSFDIKRQLTWSEVGSAYCLEHTLLLSAITFCS